MSTLPSARVFREAALQDYARPRAADPTGLSRPPFAWSAAALVLTAVLAVAAGLHFRVHEYADGWAALVSTGAGSREMVVIAAPPSTWRALSERSRVLVPSSSGGVPLRLEVVSVRTKPTRGRTLAMTHRIADDVRIPVTARAALVTAEWEGETGGEDLARYVFHAVRIETGRARLLEEIPLFRS